MLAQLTLSQTLPTASSITHLLVLLPKAKVLPKGLPHAALLNAVLARRDIKADELAKSPVAANAENGALVAWGMLDFEKDTFAQQVQVRKALQLLLGENPKGIGIVVLGNEAQRRRAAELAVYGAWVNGAPLPVHKKKDAHKPLQKIELFGLSQSLPPGRGKVRMGVESSGSKVSTPSLTLPLHGGGDVFGTLKAQAEGNLLCRELTVLPPNELTPALYRARIKKLARQNGWKHEEFDMKKLRKMGAGAFVAVAARAATAPSIAASTMIEVHFMRALSPTPRRKQEFFRTRTPALRHSTALFSLLGAKWRNRCVPRSN